MADFLTPNVLNEQLAWVEHQLFITSTEPFAFHRREKLLEEKMALLRMLGRDEEITNGLYSNSSPSIQSPSLSVPGPSNSASVSGLSTPDIFAREHNAFAFSSEEPWLDDSARMAQELS